MRRRGDKFSRRRQMLIRRLVLALAVTLSAVASVAYADLYDDYINSRSRQSFVSFFARSDTVSGHAFVAVGTELDNGLTVYEGIYGYYPESGDKKFSKFRGSDRGMITFKENDYPSSIRYRNNVYDTKNKAVLEVFKKLKSDDPRYNLLTIYGKSCNNLAKEIAGKLGLRIPTGESGFIFPTNYITNLRDLNN